MAEPTCEKCGAQNFGSRYIKPAKVILAFCAECGHVVGVVPDYHDLAQSLVLTLTRGCKNGTGHPVLHVKQEDTVFG